MSAQSHVGLYYNVNWKKFAPIKLMQGVLDQIRAHVLIISLIQLGLWRFLSWWNFIRAPLTNYSSRRTFIQRGPSFWGPQEKPRSAAAPLHPPSCAFSSGLNTTWWNSSPPPPLPRPPFCRDSFSFNCYADQSRMTGIFQFLWSSQAKKRSLKTFFHGADPIKTLYKLLFYN